MTCFNYFIDCTVFYKFYSSIQLLLQVQYVNKSSSSSTVFMPVTSLLSLTCSLSSVSFISVLNFLVDLSAFFVVDILYIP